MHLRTALPDDVPSLYALWDLAFDAPLMVPVYETDDARLGRTHVAVDADDRVLASVYWVPRRIGGPSGATLLAGGVANVATAPEARGRGLVRTLLARALEQMHDAGADVALLFTGTPDVYRSSGFTTFDVPLRRGAPRPPGSTTGPGRAHGPAPLPVALDHLPGSQSPAWPAALHPEELATLHRAFDEPGGAPRPLAARRSAEHWERRVPLWYSGAEVLSVRGGSGAVAAYVVLTTEAGTLRVRELGLDPAAPGATEHVDALAAATVRRAAAHGSTTVEVRLPSHALTDRYTDGVLADRVTDVDATGMLRPVRAAGEVVDRLLSSTATGTGFHWPGDYL